MGVFVVCCNEHVVQQNSKPGRYLPIMQSWSLVLAWKRLCFPVTLVAVGKEEDMA